MKQSKWADRHQTQSSRMDYKMPQEIRFAFVEYMDAEDSLQKAIEDRDAALVRFNNAFQVAKETNQ